MNLNLILILILILAADLQEAHAPHAPIFTGHIYLLPRPRLFARVIIQLFNVN